MSDKVEVRFVSHPSEDEWEEYALGRLPENKIPRLEEHLLACTSCQSTLEQIDTIIHSLHASAAPLVEPPKAVPAASGWMPFPIRPAMVGLALAVVLVIASIVIVRSRQSQVPLQIAFVTLASFRGEGTASAPAGHALNLEISQSDIPVVRGYTLDVITLSGDSVWKGSADIVSGKLVGRVPGGLSAGSYWVRLYSPAAKLIREFGMQVM